MNFKEVFESYALHYQNPQKKINFVQYIDSLTVNINRSQRTLINSKNNSLNSALIANWIKDENPNILIHTHFLNINSDTQDFFYILKYLCESIKKLTLSDEHIEDELTALQESIPMWLAIASDYAIKQKSIWFLVFDGINDYFDYFLTLFLPPQINLVITTNNIERKYQHIESWSEINFEVVTPDCNPEEHLLAVENMYGKAIIRKILQLIWVSRLGLTKQVIIDLSSTHKIDNGVLSSILNSLDEVLIEYNDVFQILNVETRDYLKKRYLPSFHQERKIRKRLANYFLNQANNQQIVEEVAYQYQQAQYSKELRSLITQHVDLFYYYKQSHELLTYWLFLSDNNRELALFNIQKVYKKAFKKWNNECSAQDFESKKLALQDFLLYCGIHNKFTLNVIKTSVLPKNQVTSSNLLRHLTHLVVLLKSNDGQLRFDEVFDDILISHANNIAISDYPIETELFLTHLAQYLQSMSNDLINAEKFLRQAIDISKHLNVFVLWRNSLNLAEVLRLQGNFKEAEKLNRNALELSEKNFGVDHLYTAYSLSNLGIVINNNDAESLHSRSVDITKRFLGPNHPEMINRLINQSTSLTYKNKPQFKKAEILLLQALDIAEKQSDPEYQITVCIYLGRFYSHQYKDALADSFYRKALAIPNITKYSNSIQLMTDFAEFMKKMEVYQHAEFFYQIILDVSDTNDPKIPERLSNLGWALLDQDKYIEADKIFRKSLSIAQKNQDYINIENSLLSLTHSMLLQEKYAKAKPFLEQVYTISDQILNSHEPRMAYRANKLAIFFEKHKNTELAEKLYRHSLALKEIYDDYDIDITDILNNLMDLIWENGNDDNEQFARRCLEISTEKFGIRHYDTGTAYFNLGRVLSLNSQLEEEAEDLLRKSVKIAEKTVGKRSLVTSERLVLLGNHLSNMGKLESSKDLLQRAARIDESILGENIRTLTTLTQYARVLKKMKLFEEMLKVFQRIVKGAENIYGVHHEYTLLAHVLMNEIHDYN